MQAPLRVLRGLARAVSVLRVELQRERVRSLLRAMEASEARTWAEAALRWPESGEARSAHEHAFAPPVRVSAKATLPTCSLSERPSLPACARRCLLSAASSPRLASAVFVCQPPQRSSRHRRLAHAASDCEHRALSLGGHSPRPHARSTARARPLLHAAPTSRPDRLVVVRPAPPPAPAPRAPPP